MSLTDQTVFLLLRSILFTDEEVTILDCHSIFEEMKIQAIAALPGLWLERHLPAADFWCSYCALQQGKWIRIMHAQEELLLLFESNSIDCVIIKGAAAAMYYPHPSLRTMGDIDILVKRTDLDRAAVLMETNGYQLTKDKEYAKHHYSYTKGKISFELHKRLSVIDDTDEQLLTLFERGIDTREYKITEGYRFPVLPNRLNGLVLISHINQHLRQGLGLRQIIDWMMYVKSLSNNEWNDLLVLLQATGLEKLAATVTAACQKYIGLEMTFPAFAEVDEGVCDELIKYIMEKGNFGQKAGTEGKIAAFALSNCKKGDFFRRLQAGGLYRWRVARSNHFFRPFAWVYQLLRVLGILVKHKIMPKEVLTQNNRGVEQRKLIRALGLTTSIMIHFKSDNM